MADATNNMEASTLFGAGANFNPQSSSSSVGVQPANIMDATGNIQCETMVNEMTTYNNSLAYCNATPAIGADLATLATNFGDVHDSKKVDTLSINFEKGQYATVDITGHNHTANAHVAGLPMGYADVSASIPGSAGFGCPDFGLALGANATPISATLSFSNNHIDREGADGNHWQGKNTTPRAELSLTVEGLPTTTTIAAAEVDLSGWTCDSVEATDGNQDFDGYVFNLHRHYDIATA